MASGTVAHPGSLDGVELTANSWTRVWGRGGSGATLAFCSLFVLSVRPMDLSWTLVFERSAVGGRLIESFARFSYWAARQRAIPTW